ncbi:FkbM family methyltransferase [Haloplanus rallus]|uniref:FkbM family methyltransferase n=1 Tax=Haloplanus rallus TaxID=1816183 RepID=A0A6B9F5Y6_9EURY|nr:FkbM family methyltransferase [Haloplanus rallus]QGX94822.1 FkbM family methyltransferase [Haloplanus rallus]
MSLVSRAYRVLTEEGPISLVRKGSKYLFENSYWKFKKRYTLSTNNTEILFSAPDMTVVERNKTRFFSENNIIGEIIQELDRDDVFYDIGANTGLYTLFAAKNCSMVVSFEPYPPNYELLKRDISQNGISNVEVYEIALSDSNGTISFEQPVEDDVGYGSSSIVDSDTSSSIEVPTRTGDDLISENNLPIPNIVKIDVEGSEPLVIDGLEDTLSDSDCRLVYCEVHIKKVDRRPSIYDFDTDLDDIKSQLREYGFTVEEVENRGGEVFIKGNK